MSERLFTYAMWALWALCGLWSLHVAVVNLFTCLGRRGGAVRLRDVTLGRGACRGCMNSVWGTHLTADGAGGLSSVWAVASERDSGWGDAVVDAAVGVRAGRRRYMVGARWHRGTMVMTARQMESPALQWKCGDG